MINYQSHLVLNSQFQTSMNRISHLGQTCLSYVPGHLGDRTHTQTCSAGPGAGNQAGWSPW